MPTLPHLPSYSSRMRKAAKTIKRRMEDGSFMARVKSSAQWTFDCQYSGRPKQEYLDILAFYDSYGEVTKFDHLHMLTGTSYEVTFDGPIEVTAESFDTVDFNFTLIQWL